MVGEMSLEELLYTLRKQGVRVFKGEGIEVEFAPHAQLSNPLVDNSVANSSTEAKDTPQTKQSDEDDLFYSAR